MTTIAFASCAYIARRPVQPAWNDIAMAKPDLLLLLGDTAYMSWEGPCWKHEALERGYQDQMAYLPFHNLVTTVPTLAIWDDHDFGPNDSCGAEVEPALREQSLALFHRYIDFTVVHNKPHVYCAWEIDDIKVIMLDVRYYRQSAGPDATLLGLEQEAWLWQQLEHDKTFTVIGSGTPIRSGEPGKCVRDYTQFYARLSQRLRDKGRVLFLSGDIHRNDFRSHGGFFEAVSSGVACIHSSGQPIDNWGLATFGSTQVDIVLNGHAPSKALKRAIRVSNWTEIKA